MDMWVLVLDIGEKVVEIEARIVSVVQYRVYTCVSKVSFERVLFYSICRVRMEKRDWSTMFLDDHSH